MPTFETFVETEKERLAKAKEDALATLKDAQDKLTAIETELQAIAAYEAAKKGKHLPAPTGEKKPRKPRETGKRVEILALFQQFPDGATSAQLQDHLGIKGDKKSVQSLSNALSALKREGRIAQGEGRNAPYTIVSPA